MQIACSLDQPLTLQSSILTMGRFDGVHRGHQLLITTAIERARQLNFLSAVLTWEPHPNVVLRPDQPVHLLTNLEERIELIGALEPDWLIIAPFTTETMNTSAETYMRRICTALPVRELWVGADFAMGHKREGTISHLTEIGNRLGYAVGAVSRIEVDGIAISSSRVRKLLQSGAVEAIEPLLGRPFGLQGTVLIGDRRGHTIGFPTANLAIEPTHVLPADGVYAGYVFLNATPIPAVTNIGMRPTFHTMRRTIETHLLDWSGDLYGQSVRLEFHYRLRAEQKFNNVPDLVAQITRDVTHARALCTSHRIKPH